MAGPDRSELVIVALPSENDPVLSFSSEKKPHLTLLYLGENRFDSSQIDLLTGYIEHAASMLPPFMMNVESRGELGDNKADVLFFEKRWAKTITTFRENLLQNDLIAEAYAATDQYPEWTPHLTMGYPETPAKKDTREHSGFWYVNFDRVSLWTGESDGPTFQLKYDDYAEEVAMSQTERGRSATDDILQHYGVKGMKWGVRRSQSELASAPSVSDDSTKAAAIRSKAQAGGTRSLSNAELRVINERMNLEQQYAGLVGREPSRIDRGHNQVKKSLSLAKTAADVYNVINSPAGKAARKLLFGV